MKIVCDSCGAKYSIADEKVAGRVFKIRCKKCGAAIVVKGDAGQAAEAAPAAGGNFDYGGEAVWHTVVEGEQQGPFAPAQLGSMISAGTIGWDAYVWREGFDDWKPAQDIEELVQSIMNPGGAPAAAAEDPFSDQPTMMAGGGGAKSTPAPAAKASKRDAGADLFAQSEASPFGGGGGEDDDVVASAPSPRVGANQAMTGARNENSVLFSLSNLQALATGAPGGGGGASPSPSKASGPSPKAGMAAGEGSGLIDIRALASATGLTGGGGGFGSAPSMGSAPPKLDELISIGAPSGGLGGALGAPVIIAEKPEPARGGGGGMIAAAAIVAIALLGGAGIFAYVSLNQPDPAATAPATAAIAPTAPPVTAAAPPPPTTVVAAVDPAATAGAATPPPATTAAAAGGGGGGGSHHPRGGGGGGGGTTTAAATPAATPAPRGGGGGGGGSGGDRSIDALLEGALGGGAAHPAPRGGGGGGAAAPAADSSLPPTPDRGAVVSAMNGVNSAVTACGGGEHGVATVAIAVAGSTGRISSATVTGQFAGTPVGSCVARAVRGATFPHFRNPSFTFNYPFRL